MGLSETHRFLIAGNRAAGPELYFRWRDVGTSLGYTDAESDQAVRALDARKLVLLLVGGDARLLSAGRDLAVKLEAKFQGAARPRSNV